MASGAVTVLGRYGVGDTTTISGAISAAYTAPNDKYVVVPASNGQEVTIYFIQS